MERRKFEHGCVHEEDWGTMKEWKEQTQKTIDRVSGMFIQSYVQIILLLGIVAVAIMTYFKKV